MGPYVRGEVDEAGRVVGEDHLVGVAPLAQRGDGGHAVVEAEDGVDAEAVHPDERAASHDLFEVVPRSVVSPEWPITTREVDPLLGEHPLLLEPAPAQAWVWVQMDTPVARWARATARSTRSTSGSPPADRCRI